MVRRRIQPGCGLNSLPAKGVTGDWGWERSTQSVKIRLLLCVQSYLVAQLLPWFKGRRHDNITALRNVKAEKDLARVDVSDLCYDLLRLGKAIVPEEQRESCHGNDCHPTLGIVKQLPPVKQR